MKSTPGLAARRSEGAKKRLSFSFFYLFGPGCRPVDRDRSHPGPGGQIQVDGTSYTRCPVSAAIKNIIAEMMMT
jgi:hypothetical protein